MLHIPLLAKLLDIYEMGGQARLNHFTEGFPTIGVLAEPGVYPAANAEAAMGGAKTRAAFPERNDPKNAGILEEALRKGRLEGPFKYDSDGSLRKGGGAFAVNPALRFGVQQAGRLRAVGDLRRSFTYKATSAHTPINLPPWSHAAQLCEYYSAHGDRRPLAMARADHVDACKQFPLLE